MRLDKFLELKQKLQQAMDDGKNTRHAKEKLIIYPMLALDYLENESQVYCTENYKLHPFLIFYCYTWEILMSDDTLSNKLSNLERVFTTSNVDDTKLATFESVLETRYNYILGYKYIEKQYNNFLLGNLSLDALMESLVEEYVDYTELDLDIDLDTLLCLEIKEGK